MPQKKSTYTRYSFSEIADEDEYSDNVIAGETYGIDKSSVMLHCHDYIEICYIKQGTGTYLIDGNDYSFEAGDIFVMGSNEIHLAYNDRNVIMMVFLFKPGLLWSGAGYTFEMDYLRTYWIIKQLRRHKIRPDDEFHPILADTIFEMFHEQNEKAAGYKLIVKSQLLKFTGYLRRSLGQEVGETRDSWGKDADLLLPVLEYMRTYYYKKIRIETLAALANMGISTFNLHFKKVIGATPIEYINKIRVVKASQMLLETDGKIIDIAAECGFFSLPHFIGCFKKYTGKLPKDFRSIVHDQP